MSPLTRAERDSVQRVRRLGAQAAGSDQEPQAAGSDQGREISGPRRRRERLPRVRGGENGSPCGPLGRRGLRGLRGCGLGDGPAVTFMPPSSPPSSADSVASSARSASRSDRNGSQINTAATGILISANKIRTMITQLDIPSPDATTAERRSRVGDAGETHQGEAGVRSHTSRETAQAPLAQPVSLHNVHYRPLSARAALQAAR